MDSGLATSPAWICDATLTQFVDSAALGYFMSLHKRAESMDVDLRFVGVQPRVRHIFRIAKVDAVLLEPEATPSPTAPG